MDCHPPHHLLVTINALHPKEVKYFISNAPPETPIETLLLVAFSRWRIERMFEDGKDELGLDHFGVRQFLAIRRHLVLCCVSYLFFAEFHQKQWKKPIADGCPGAHRGATTGPDPGGWGGCGPRLAKVISVQLQYTQEANANAARSHREHTSRRLLDAGLHLRDLRRCSWNSL